MRRSKADPLDTADRSDHPDQAAEIDLAEAIGVDRLAEQDDFFYAARGQRRDFANHRIGGDAAFASAHVWNHAKGAELVAPAHRGNVRANAVLMLGRDVGVGLGSVERDIDRGIEAGAPDQLGQAAIAVGSGDEVEPGRLFDDRSAIVLRHASEQTEPYSRPAALEAGQLAEPLEHALFGVLADSAGVEQDDVGVFSLLGAPEAGLTHHGPHGLRVRDIHLASVGLDIDPRLRRDVGESLHIRK